LERRELHNKNEFCQSVILKLKYNLSIDEIKNIIQQLINNHDILRLRYDVKSQELFFDESLLNAQVDIKEYYCLNEGVCSFIDKKKASHIQSLDISKKVIDLFTCRESSSMYLTIIIHHIAVDGYSWQIILDDLETMFTQVLRGQDPKLHYYSNTYQEWSNNMENKTHKISILNDNITNKSVNTQSQFVDEFKLRIIKNNSIKNYHSDIVETFLASALFAITNNLDLTNSYLLYESHGRNTNAEGYDYSRTVGWFTSLKSVKITKKCNNVYESIMEAKYYYNLLIF